MINSVILAVKILLYLAILIGIWLMFSYDIFYFIRAIKPQSIFRKEESGYSEFYRHIKKLLLVAKGKDDDRTISTFYLMSIALFLITLIIVIQKTTITRGLVFSVIIGLTPYLYLRLKLKKIRIDSSHEADSVINEFINQYKLNQYNIYDTVDETISRIREAPQMKKQLFIMSLKLKEYRTLEELDKLLRDLVYAVRTEWSVLFVNNLYISVADNVNILAGLEDIQREIKQAIVDKERENRLNMESISMAKYLTPALYILSIIAANTIFNISAGEFIRIQLGTRIGFNYFMLITTMSLLNTGLIILLKRQKFDI